MKGIIPFILTFFVFCGTVLAGDLPYLTSALGKTYRTTQTFPGKEVDLMVRVLTSSAVEPYDRKGSILYAFKYHELLCRAFERRGWKVIHPLSDNVDAGTLELTFEPRMKGVVMKTFIYPCDSSRLWNMMKYRGGSEAKYFDQVVRKAIGCIRDKFQLYEGQ